MDYATPGQVVLGTIKSQTEQVMTASQQAIFLYDLCFFLVPALTLLDDGQQALR